MSLKTTTIETPLGPMQAASDDKQLHYLNFVDSIEDLEAMPGPTEPLRSIAKELDLYFSGKLKRFETPLFFQGTPFQKRVWAELLTIPYAQTCSYADVAAAIGKPKACRAVGSANGRNRLALIIPCHRVINASGKSGGYGGGMERKEWLLQHEQRHD